MGGMKQLVVTMHGKLEGAQLRSQSQSQLQVPMLQPLPAVRRQEWSSLFLPSMLATHHPQILDLRGRKKPRSATYCSFPELRHDFVPSQLVLDDTDEHIADSNVLRHDEGRNMPGSFATFHYYKEASI